jgi:hypothetical protein
VHTLRTKEENVPPQLASQLRQLIPPNAQVFTTEWGLTGTLMLALPERRFIVALDPTYFYMKDPELYRLWYSLPREAPSDAADKIRRHFKARYVLSLWDHRWKNFYYVLSSDRSVKTLLITDYWLLFDLGPT